MLDTNKPVELYNTKTGEIIDLPDGVRVIEAVVNRPYLDTYPVRTPGDHWRNYSMDGSPVIRDNFYVVRNKKEDMNMALNLNKPLVVNDKEAKVVHQFDNGNLAVVVDGYSEVQNFDSKGRRIGDSVQILKNKVVEEVQYVNIYPGRDSDTTTASAFIYKTLSEARCRIRGSYAEGSGFTLKRVIRDGVIVSNEVI